MATLGDKVLFTGADSSTAKDITNNSLWISDGTAGRDERNRRARQCRRRRRSGDGARRFRLTTYGNEVLFEGVDSAGVKGLWVTNGTAGGTYELEGDRRREFEWPHARLSHCVHRGTGRRLDQYAIGNAELVHPPPVGASANAQINSTTSPSMSPRPRLLPSMVRRSFKPKPSRMHRHALDAGMLAIGLAGSDADRRRADRRLLHHGQVMGRNPSGDVEVPAQLNVVDSTLTAASVNDSGEVSVTSGRAAPSTLNVSGAFATAAGNNGNANSPGVLTVGAAKQAAAVRRRSARSTIKARSIMIVSSSLSTLLVERRRLRDGRGLGRRRSDRGRRGDPICPGRRHHRYRGKSPRSTTSTTTALARFSFDVGHKDYANALDPLTAIGDGSVLGFEDYGSSASLSHWRQHREQWHDRSSMWTQGLPAAALSLCAVTNEALDRHRRQWSLERRLDQFWQCRDGPRLRA